jgi:hypothetical protein
VKGEDDKERPCHLLLDNFTYESLSGDDACKSSLRKRWLERQPPEHLKQTFRPQPYEQVIKVLRAMGHYNDADEIGMSKRWRAWSAKPWWSWRSLGVGAFVSKLAELVFVRWFLGYGYQEGRRFFILFIFVCGFALFYQQAFEQGAIVPSDKEIRALDCKNWTALECPKIVGKVVPFKAWLYSADVMIPIIGLGQKSAWQPAPDRSLQTLGWESPTNIVYYSQLFETALGWVGSLLLVSFISGLITEE